MAAKKTYVHVDKLGVTKIFDQQYKAKAMDFMGKTAKRMIEKSSGLTIKTKDKKADGFYLGGGMTKLAKGEKNGKMLLAGEISLQLASWPKKSMFGFATSKGMIEVMNEAKLDRDIEDLITALFESAVRKKAIKTFEQRAKK